MAVEERSSGIIGQDIIELDQAIEAILGLIETAEYETRKNADKTGTEVEREKETAESVRKRSSERLSETRGREKGGDIECKRRKVDGEAIAYLKNERGNGQ